MTAGSIGARSAAEIGARTTDYDAARASYQEALRLSPDRPEVCNNLAVAFTALRLSLAVGLPAGSPAMASSAKRISLIGAA